MSYDGINFVNALNSILLSQYTSDDDKGGENKNMSKRQITLGTWEGKPIKWIVLKEQDGRALVVSRDILFNRRFDQYRDHNGNKWDNCELRSFLNSDFYINAFKDYEKKKVINSLIEEFKVKDNVFLLNSEQAELLSSNERNKGCIWSLRTPHGDGLEYTSHVTSNGEIKCISSQFTYTDIAYAIRPAMWIKE